MSELNAGVFFDLEGLGHRALLESDEAVWTALDRLKDYLAAAFDHPWPLAGITGQIDRPLVLVDGVLRDDLDVRPTGPKGKVRALDGNGIIEGAAIVMAGAHLFDDRLILGPGSVVEPGALIKGPTVIGAHTEVRQGAYIRGTTLVGDGCVVGHTTEVKGSVMLDGSKAGHFAYIGDSILGRDVNLGAGTKLANLRMVPGTIRIAVGKIRVDTGRRKLGAILGDRTETGCNSVTSPGTLLGPRSVIYPGLCAPAGGHPTRTYVTPGADSVRIREL